MDQRQSVQSPRVSDRGSFRKADQNRLHASAAAAGESLSLQLRATQRSAANHAAARIIGFGASEFGVAAEKRNLSDAHGSHSTSGAFGASRFRRAGIYSGSRFRSGVRNRWTKFRRRRRAASPRRRWVFAAANHAAGQRRQLAARNSARRQAAPGRAAMRHFRFDGFRKAEAAGRIRGDGAGIAG